MTGHHQDDQAETVLMQLAFEKFSPGHLGIKSRNPIPECWGMHGVHQSGHFESTEYVGRHMDHMLHSRPDLQNSTAEHTQPVVQSPRIVEAGGVKLLRPLLEFSKAELIATCKSSGVTWEEDKTNSEVWRTPRNAIRALLHREELPVALRKRNLLDMVNRSQARDFWLKEQSDAIKNACDVVSFDLRFGVLKVRMVETVTFEAGKEDPLIASSRRRIAACVLESFLTSVSPLQTVRLQALATAVEEVFPDVQAKTSSKHDNKVSLTAGGVLLQRQHMPISESATPNGNSHSPSLDPSYIWVFSRQPPQDNHSDINIPPFSNDTKDSQHTSNESGAWQLWDGRYWIRVNNFGPAPLVIRHLRSSDMETIPTVLSTMSWKLFCVLLREAAPGKIRWTLPVIVQPAVKEGDKDKILVLPSLGKKGQVDVFTRDGKKRLEWDIRYKKISLKRIELRTDCLISWDGDQIIKGEVRQTSDAKSVPDSAKQQIT